MTAAVISFPVADLAHRDQQALESRMRRDVFRRWAPRSHETERRYPPLQRVGAGVLAIWVPVAPKAAP